MRYLTCLVILTFAVVSVVYAEIDPNTIAGIWLLDEERDDFAEDLSGNNHEGTVLGAKWDKGKFGNGLRFDKAGEVKIESTEKLQLAEEFTFMAFFLTEALDDWHQIIAKDAEYLLRIDPPAEGTKMSAFVMLTGAWEPRASAFVPDKDTWYHFAAVFDLGAKDFQLKVYVNGEQKGQSSRAGKPIPGNAPVTFGHWGGGSRFKGIVDDVGIFRAALEPEDIMEIATKGLKEAILPESVEASAKLATKWGRLKR